MQKKVTFQLGVILVSALALVLLSIPLFKGTGSARKPLTPRGAPQSSQKPGSTKTDLFGQTIKVQQIKDDKFFERLSRVAEALPIDHDPFSFVNMGPKSSREGLELSGVLWDSEKPTAIINQAFFKAGDVSDQFTVVKISQDRVVLKDSAGEFELRLKQ